MRNYFFLLLTALMLQPVKAQDLDTLSLGFREYLGYVKKYHPIARQAHLKLNEGEAQLLKARGGFDPKFEVDYDKKVFKDTEYYNLLNGTFKIPTWFGIELKAQFEQNSGVYVNPQNNVPEDGLYAAGISIPLGQGLWINERMATLRQAKLYRQQTQAERDLAVNQILYEASLAYFDWLRAYEQVDLYDDFLQNAQVRFEGIRQSALAGDRAMIDTTEAKITVQNRALSLREAQLAYFKTSLELSTYLWLGNNIPIELQPNIKPQENINAIVNQVLDLNTAILIDLGLEDHPKIKSLGLKVDQLDVERRLKANKLLPQLDINYNIITSDIEGTRPYDGGNYKAGLSFSFPLLLRKERGDLALAKFKLQDAELNFSNTQVQLKNKILTTVGEIEAVSEQNQLIYEIVANYERMVSGEERKFSVGESSVFLVNTRERQLVDAQLKAIDLENKLLKVKAKLFNVLAKNPEGI